MHHYYLELYIMIIVCFLKLSFIYIVHVLVCNVVVSLFIAVQSRYLKHFQLSCLYP